MHDRFLRWCKENPSEAAHGLWRLWDGSHETESAANEFLDGVPKALIKGAGSGASLAAFLLMARGARQHPMYRSNVFKKAYQLAGYRKLMPGADGAQEYLYGLAFLDRLIEQAHKRELALRDRLDAQGVIWA